MWVNAIDKASNARGDKNNGRVDSVKAAHQHE